MARKAKNLLVCYDPGTSLSKILYRVGRGKIKYMTMEAPLLKLPPSSANSLPTSSGLGKPEDNAWVRLVADGVVYVIGRLAKEYRASVRIKKLKYESLVPKILAAVAAIAIAEGLKLEFDLNLAVLLPFGEYGNQKELEADFREAIKSFWFQGVRYQVNLKDYCCRVEGYGIVTNHLKAQGKEQFQRQTMAYLMFGYRNTSLLLFRKGTLSSGESSTTQLGFHNMSDWIAAKSPGLSRDEVLCAIYTLELGFYNPKKAMRDCRQVTEISVDDLVKSTDPDKVAAEKEVISAAILTAMGEYWGLLENWLDEVLPPLRQLDGVVCCGGTLEFFKDKIPEYFSRLNPSLKLSLTETSQRELVAALNLEQYGQKAFKEQNLALRFADVWGLFVQFAGFEPKKESAKQKAA